MDYVLVDSDEKLKKAAKEWDTDLGIDLECENNLHHYGMYLSLIQISNGQNWVVDALAVNDLSPIKNILEDNTLQKIFHDVSFDLRILYHELKVQPKNIFDTQIAASFLAKKNLGLGSLLEEYFGINKKSKFQRADWTKRPLSNKMLQYATKDTAYLLQLRDKLKGELKEKNRLEWVQQENKALEEMDWTLHQGTFMDIRGLRNMTDQQRAVLKELYDLREKYAKKVDRPVHYIMSTRRMKELAKNPPPLKRWNHLKGVHPVVKQQSKEFYDAVQHAKKKRIKMPKRPRRKRYSMEQKTLLNRLAEARDKLSGEIGLPKHLILSKDQMHDIVNGRHTLRPWQMELLDDFAS